MKCGIHPRRKQQVLDQIGVMRQDRRRFKMASPTRLSSGECYVCAPRPFLPITPNAASLITHQELGPRGLHKAKKPGEKLLVLRPGQRRRDGPQGFDTAVGDACLLSNIGVLRGDRSGEWECSFIPSFVRSSKDRLSPKIHLLSHCRIPAHLLVMRPLAPSARLLEHGGD